MSDIKAIVFIVILIIMVILTIPFTQYLYDSSMFNHGYIWVPTLQGHWEYRPVEKIKQ